MEVGILTFAAFLISILTFFSGFGLGTLLTPIFMIYFPVEMAILSVLLLIFSGIELIPYFKKIEFNKDKLIFGGVLSGFFGGLSGVQGAFRSAFLVRYGLTKEEFVSTTVFISTLVDMTRLSVYYKNLQNIEDINYVSVIYPIVGALVGSYLGLNLLKKVTIESIQLLVGILLGIFAICLGMGIF